MFLSFSGMLTSSEPRRRPSGPQLPLQVRPGRCAVAGAARQDAVRVQGPPPAGGLPPLGRPQGQEVPVLRRRLGRRRHRLRRRLGRRPPQLQAPVHRRHGPALRRGVPLPEAQAGGGPPLPQGRQPQREEQGDADAAPPGSGQVSLRHHGPAAQARGQGQRPGPPRADRAAQERKGR